jgi:predicted O-methyltransferase YrrM
MRRSIGYLRKTGWVRSHFESRVVDEQGNAIPWYAYPFVEFIKGRLQPEMSVFEYGAGYSTLFYSSKVRQVISVETDQDWIKLLEKMIAKHDIKNVEVCHFDTATPGVGVEYRNFITKFNKKFDIIVVDAEYRNECLTNTIDKLTGGGVIILDDSERTEYEEGTRYLSQNGFKRIDFWGINSRIYWPKCTTIFYRGENVLGI